MLYAPEAATGTVDCWLTDLRHSSCTDVSLSSNFTYWDMHSFRPTKHCVVSVCIEGSHSSCQKRTRISMFMAVDSSVKGNLRNRNQRSWYVLLLSGRLNARHIYFSCRSYFTTDGQSVSICLGVERTLGLETTYYFLSEGCGLVSVGRPLWREDRSAVCSAITHWSGSRRTRNHTSLSHSDSPHLEGQPYFYRPGTGWPRVALGFNSRYFFTLSRAF
jgi:hypothetical protein